MAGNRILVIDDEPGVIQLCKRVLEKSGYDILAFTSPLEGLQALEGNKAEMLLVDIRMPEMDGFAVMAAARLRQPELAVVIMTGYGTLETAIQALQRGADGLILKPFTGKELVASVQHALEQSRAKQDVLRLQALRPLFDVSETLFSETNPERLHELLLGAVCGHLRSALAAYFQQNMAGDFELVRYQIFGNITWLSAENNPAPDSRQILDAFLPFIQRTLQTGVTLMETASVPLNLAGLPGQTIGSVMCTPLPLKSAAGSAHCLLAARWNSDPVFHEADLEMFVVLARQAAVAIENARLHAELHAYIRQLEESQRALIQAEKMAIAGRLTASIAHEINNPLQSVQNCLHLAGRKELDAKERQDYLGMAQEELRRLMDTVQRMLDYYRPGALERKPTDLRTLIQRVLVLMDKQLKDHSIQVHYTVAEDVPPVYVVGDQIQQVFLNMILNAVEAMPAGGSLHIHARQERDMVMIDFRDTGPGIPEENRKSIFEPFYSTKQGGTGLGLAISYGIITAHNGALELIDEPGAGACFRIILRAGES